MDGERPARGLPILFLYGKLFGVIWTDIRARDANELILTQRCTGQEFSPWGPGHCWGVQSRAPVGCLAVISANLPRNCCLLPYFFFFQGVMSLAFWGVACFGWGCPCDTAPWIREALLALSNLAALWQTAGAAHKAAPVF